MAEAVETILRRMKDGSSREVLGRKVTKIHRDWYLLGKDTYSTGQAASVLGGQSESSPLEGRYYEGRRVRGWSSRPNVLQVRQGPLTRGVFPELKKEDHGRLAREFAEKARAERIVYKKTLDRAVARYGDLPPGKTATSGIYNPDFPDTVKDRLRQILGRMNNFTDASVAHYEASGKRTPWRDSELKAIAYPPGSYY